MIEPYIFSLNEELILGESKTFAIGKITETGRNDGMLSANVPFPNMVFVTQICVGNSNLLSVDESIDLADIKQGMLIPPYGCGYSICITGLYSGYVPPGYKVGDTFTLSFAIHGSAK